MFVRVFVADDSLCCVIPFEAAARSVRDVRQQTELIQEVPVADIAGCFQVAGPDGIHKLAQMARRIGNRLRRDVWYVPMGLLYAFRTIHERTDVRQVGPAKYAVSHSLDKTIYNGAITLDFEAPAGTEVLSRGKRLRERTNEMTDRWTEEYVRREGGHLYVTVLPNTTLEFRQR